MMQDESVRVHVCAQYEVRSLCCGTYSGLGLGGSVAKLGMTSMGDLGGCYG